MTSLSSLLPRSLSSKEADTVAKAQGWSMFKDVLHVNDRGRSFYLEQLWESVSPNGNIYRRNAFYHEHRVHSLDLWQQMYEIAAKHRALLEGDSSDSIEDCAQKLYDALRDTEVVLPDDEAPETLLGYPPIEEFLSDRVEQWGPLVMYKDEDKRTEEIKHRLISLNVFLLQTIAPFLIFRNGWNLETNYFRELFKKGNLSSKLTAAELFCLGTNFQDACTTILGMQLLFAIIFITRCYVDQQVDDVRKWQRLPHSSFYLLMDVFANAWSVVFIMLGVPLLFWSEETPTNIVLDSMTLLFLFNLDDLSDVLCSYIGMTQRDFKRTVASMSAFLSRCPADLERVINAEAKSSKDLWRIQFDKEGKLLATDGSRCTTRLQFVNHGEDTATASSGDRARRGSRLLHYGSTLLATNPEPSTSEIKLICWRSRTQCTIMPALDTVLLTGVWEILAKVVWVGNIAIPLLWYLIGKPCWPK